MTHYATDKLARANQLGYPDYLSALIALYCDEQLSFAQVGRIFWDYLDCCEIPNQTSGYADTRQGW